MNSKNDAKDRRSTQAPGSGSHVRLQGSHLLAVKFLHGLLQSQIAVVLSRARHWPTLQIEVVDCVPTVRARAVVPAKGLLAVLHVLEEHSCKGLVVTWAAVRLLEQL